MEQLLINDKPILLYAYVAVFQQKHVPEKLKLSWMLKICR